MRHLLLLILTLSLQGCALFSKEKLSAKPLVSCANANKTIEASCNAAVDAVEKANILTASINTAIDDRLNARTITKAQAQSYRDRTKQADVALDDATKMIQNAEYSFALNKATLTKAILDKLNEEVAAQVAKGK